MLTKELIQQMKSLTQIFKEGQDNYTEKLSGELGYNQYKKLTKVLRNIAEDMKNPWTTSDIDAFFDMIDAFTNVTTLFQKDYADGEYYASPDNMKKIAKYADRIRNRFESIAQNMENITDEEIKSTFEQRHEQYKKIDKEQMELCRLFSISTLENNIDRLYKLLQTSTELTLRNWMSTKEHKAVESKEEREHREEILKLQAELDALTVPQDGACAGATASAATKPQAGRPL